MERILVRHIRHKHCKEADGFRRVIKKNAHVTENVHVVSFISTQGGHPTQKCNIINSSHNTIPGKWGGGGAGRKFLCFSPKRAKKILKT